MKSMLFAKKRPPVALPSEKTDLHKLDPEQDSLVWFGHSSYYLQLDGKRFLIDPVFSGAASPVRFTTRAFPGTDPYQADDLPDIDYLLISHDHWDHLDYDTIRKLRPRIKRVITGLGTGAHLRRWGFSDENVWEADWGERIDLAPGLSVHAVPARHFSGRSFTRNKSLWTSFVIKSSARQIFVCGDSGYGPHFASIGQTFGSFDLALMEDGQYAFAWRHIHMLPEEILRAARDLGAKCLLPGHNCKFALALHTWDEPLNRIASLCREDKMPIMTPLIGQVVNLQEPPKFKEWWRSVGK